MPLINANDVNADYLARNYGLQEGEECERHTFAG
jgi:hypothetical protein